MTLHLDTLCFDAHDPELLTRFWAGVMGRTADGHVLEPEDVTDFRIRFLATKAPRTGPNQIHVDLVSRRPEEQQQTVERALALGGRHLDIGQGPDADHVVMADPEGNEFCVIPAGNTFLAGCPTLGALSSDGSQAVGYFWAEALGWPLVWDQDQETAIQAPYGGSKISWGGPPVNPKTGKNRLHLDLMPAPDSDQQAEVARLVSLGATRVEPTHEVPGAVALVDVDGNELCVLASPQAPDPS